MIFFPRVALAFERGVFSFSFNECSHISKDFDLSNSHLGNSLCNVPKVLG